MLSIIIIKQKILPCIRNPHGVLFDSRCILTLSIVYDGILVTFYIPIGTDLRKSK